MARGAASSLVRTPADEQAVLLAAFAAATDADERRSLLDRVVAEYLGLSDALARGYALRGIELDDLVQVARFALVKAIFRYRPQPGGFVAYAVPTIRGELKRHFRDTGWTVRPPRRLQELRARLRQCEEDALAGGPAGDPDAVSDALGVPPGELAEVRNLGWTYTPVSLDAVGAHGDGTTLADRLGSGDRRIDDLPELLSLRDAVGRLPERDQKVVAWRFAEERTQAEIGARLGVSQMQVSRILVRIVDRLRAELTAAPAT